MIGGRVKRYVKDIGSIVNDRLNIVDVISEYISLKRAGRNLKACCPFHSEKTPSFIVSEDKQIFKCFGCGESGNLITFVMKHLNLDFINAIELLAEKYNINLEEHVIGEAEKYNYKDFYNINLTVAREYFLLLQKNNNAKEYLHKRGLTDATIRKFGLGFSKDSWDYIYKKYLNKMDKELVDKSGLFIKKENGYYDRFRNRIMFPIFDIRNRVIGFGARAFSKTEKIKYLNSPQSPLYNKSYHLYGLNYAKDEIVDESIILVEGYIDVISLYNKGIKNVVASLGTSLTSEQAKLLARYSKNVIIIYDSDKAGITATYRAIKVLEEVDINTYALSLDHGLDPDDYIKEHSKEEFLELLKNKKQDYNFILDIIKKEYDFNDLNQKYEYLNRVIKIIDGIKNKLKREFLISKTLEELDISVEQYNEIEKIKNQNKLVEKTQKHSKKDSLAKELFLAISLSDLDIIREIIKNENYQYLNNEYKKLFSIVVSNGGFNNEIIIDNFSFEKAEYIFKTYNMKYTNEDKNNWKILYNFVIDESLQKRIKELSEDKKNFLLLKELQNKRAKISIGGEIDS